MTSAPRARKISKPMAMARFIEVTIDLLETLPIAEVSDHLIADTAQISRSSIYRYFNTRLELFDLVLDTLIQNYLADLQVVATPFAQPQKVPKSPSTCWPLLLRSVQKYSRLAIT